MTLSRQLTFYDIDTKAEVIVTTRRWEICEAFRDGKKYLVIKGTRTGALESFLTQNASLLGITLEWQSVGHTVIEDVARDLPDSPVQLGPPDEQDSSDLRGDFSQQMLDDA